MRRGRERRGVCASFACSGPDAGVDVGVGVGAGRPRERGWPMVALEQQGRVSLRR